MIKQIKIYIQKAFRFVGINREKYAHSWLYSRSVLEWVAKSSIGQQLPPLYQVFRAYCSLYFSLFDDVILVGGRTLFEFLSKIFYFFSPKSYLKFILGEYEVYLDPFDPRFFQVVNEIINRNSDVQVLHQLLSNGDSFIDVGANHGSFSIIASKLVGSQGLVIAVEPQPRLAKAVEQSLNSTALCPFQVHQVAVGAIEGEIELLVPRGSSGSAGIYSEHSATHEYYTLQVPIQRFDSLVDWHQLPGQVLIKLDVEGSELEFLAGAAEMLTSLKPKLIIEVHPGTLKAAGKTGEDLKKALKDLGYQQYSELSDPKDIFSIENLNTQIQRNVIMLTN